VDFDPVAVDPIPAALESPPVAVDPIAEAEAL
jgi:hypothetical protein